MSNVPSWPTDAGGSSVPSSRFGAKIGQTGLAMATKLVCEIVCGGQLAPLHDGCEVEATIRCTALTPTPASVERVNAGLARARAQGKTLGRPKVDAATEARIRTLWAAGCGINKTAKGVAASQDGKAIEYRGPGEVILSAGGLNSPLILQRSGIGPAEHLRSLGVSVVADQPATIESTDCA